MSGLWTTFEIFILTLIFSLPLGLIFAFGLLSRFKPVKAVMNVFVWVIRGTPLMLQLIIIFYGPGLWLHQAIWSGDETGRITATVVAFVINYACYFSVIFRGGIEGVPAGQREAGQVLGMTKQQIFFKITLLQMIKRVVPPMSNEIITLVKDSTKICCMTDLHGHCFIQVYFISYLSESLHFYLIISRKSWIISGRRKTWQF